MTSAIDKNCTFLISNEKASGLQQEDICKDLESNDVEIKIRLELLCFVFIIEFIYSQKLFLLYRGLKNAIFALLSNENMPRVLMTVIRQVILLNYVIIIML